MVVRYTGNEGMKYEKATLNSVLNHVKGKSYAFVSMKDKIMIPAGEKNSLDLDMEVIPMDSDEHADLLIGIWTGTMVL
jgi:hypothetical protein